MDNSEESKTKIYEENGEMFDLAEEIRRSSVLFLKNFNSRKVKLASLEPRKRIFLFFLTKIIKTYSAVYALCREGYGQDVCPLLRSSLETLISAKYILYDPAAADKNAARFVEYKWVIFKRYLGEFEKGPLDKSQGKISSSKQLILEKFKEYKEKYGISSDRGLLTWSGKPIRDMAKLVDEKLLGEYESAFRIDSRFSHPSILSDNEYLDYDDYILKLSPLPSDAGVVTNLKRAITYLIEFLGLFNELFGLQYEARLMELQSRVDEVFNMEKYKKEITFGKSFPNLNKKDLEKVLVQFDLPL
ncbi:MAG: DUF5677 domain-containing protein [Candidatus Omnitrophica bacterium]|nr:DUF5677 domain-containing protein [Candidatus Omnitrophota bacterium]